MLYDAIALGQIRKILEMGPLVDGINMWCRGKRGFQLLSQLIFIEYFHTFFVSLNPPNDPIKSLVLFHFTEDKL